jgi:iron(III) transport system ATP-binding protein
MDGLVLQNVSHKFGATVALEGVDLTVASGEIVCLLGPSGCGKTTTLRLAAGLERLQAGTIQIGGSQVASAQAQVPANERNLGMVFQDYALFPHLNTIENVVFGLRQESKEARMAKARDLLSRLSMTGFETSFPHRLSGGEQQRVALARALATSPALMLLDEPFANLDVSLRNSVCDDTLSLLRGEGTATLMVTHDPDEAMRMADKIALMRDGRIVQVGTPMDFHDRPSSKFVATFFRETNVIAGTVNTNGAVDTALGPIPLNGGCGYAAGQDIDLILAPEAVLLNNGGELPAIVSDVRWVGAYGVVDLTVAGFDEKLRAYAFDRTLPQTGERLKIALDPKRVFVFPREAP